MGGPGVTWHWHRHQNQSQLLGDYHKSKNPSGKDEGGGCFVVFVKIESCVLDIDIWVGSNIFKEGNGPPV